MNQQFSSSEKLKSKKLIDQLFSEGKAVNQFPLKLIYSAVKSAEEPKFFTGVSVPKKNFKKAVDRNHLKRLLRECYRKNKYIVESNIQQPYAFMIIYVGREEMDYNMIFSLMEKLLKKFVDKEEN